MPKKIDLSGENSTNLTIPLRNLQKMVDRYKMERYNHFVPKPIKHDSRAIWLSRSAIEGLFKKNPKSTGFRIYFGVVGGSKGVHNLVFIPTVKNKYSKFNVDMVSENDWVLVSEVFTPPFDDEPQVDIIPPPEQAGNALKL